MATVHCTIDEIDVRNLADSSSNVASVSPETLSVSNSTARDLVVQCDSAIAMDVVRLTGGRRRRGFATRLARRMTWLGLRLAMKCLRRNWTTSAISILRGLVALFPNELIARFWLARALADWSESEAVELCESITTTQLQRSHPHLSTVCCRIADLLLYLERFDAAVRYVEFAKRLYPKSPVVWRVHGKLCRARAHTDSAANSFKVESQLAPTKRLTVGALLGMADCIASEGRKDEAVALYRHILEVEPSEGLAYYGLVESRAVHGLNDPVVEQMRNALEMPTATPMQRTGLHYALGKLYDDARHPAEAFAHFALANHLRSARFPPGHLRMAYETSAAEERVSIFTREFISDFSQYGCHADFLICIVGMPRSGTTLAEQILSAHSSVRGLGERQDFFNLTQRLSRELKSNLPYPKCCAGLTPSVVQRVSLQIYDRLRAIAGATARVVTKCPHDAFDLGLIRILFPKARFVHCKRNAIDTCLSAYMQHFEMVPFATDLGQLATVYKLYDKLMRHWYSVLDRDSLFELSYETLVAEPASVIQRLTTFSALPFEDACMRFFESVRQVDTASRWQVRRPIYSTSVMRWERYREFLGPLLSLEHNT
ncbi:MAG: sulfotransferase [Planctomycetia bacterium]|nr:sulfotransferase [Planctomycetia bacterium]